MISKIDGALAHPSDILDYFRGKQEVTKSGDRENMLRNSKKVISANKPAWALTVKGLSFCFSIQSIPPQ